MAQHLFDDLIGLIEEPDGERNAVLDLVCTPNRSSHP